MLREYLKKLETTYNYIGNWPPDEQVSVGSFILLEPDFIEGLKNVLGIRIRTENINESLHKFEFNEIKNIETEQINLPDIQITDQVETKWSIEGQKLVVNSEAQNGFFISLNHVKKVLMTKDSIERAKNQIECACALVTGVTYAQGIISIFEGKNSSLQIDFSKQRINVYGNRISNGVISYFSSHKHNLFPFLQILIIERKEKFGLIGDRKNTLQDCSFDFSYVKFLNAYDSNI